MLRRLGVDSGGIASLAATLEQYRGPVGADFRRFYHRGLQDSLDELGCREVWNMIRYLPQDAALWRVQEPDEPSKPEPEAIRADASNIAAILGPLGIPVS